MGRADCEGGLSLDEYSTTSSSSLSEAADVRDAGGDFTKGLYGLGDFGVKGCLQLTCPSSDKPCVDLVGRGDCESNARSGGLIANGPNVDLDFNLAGSGDLLLALELAVDPCAEFCDSDAEQPLDVDDRVDEPRCDVCDAYLVMWVQAMRDSPVLF